MAGTILDSGIRVHVTELKGVKDMAVRDLFGGFDELKAITFSSNIRFLEELAGLFTKCEIVLGAAFQVRKDRGAHDAFYQVMAAAQINGMLPVDYPNIGLLMQAGAFDARTATILLDHRKIYIMRNISTGATRVVKSSANMTGRAWNGDQSEFYDCDDTAAAYDEYARLFDAAWSVSSPVPYRVAKVSDDDIVSGNAVIQNSIHLNNMLVVPEADDPVRRELVEYAVRADPLADEYKSMFQSVLRLKGSLRHGLYQLKPEQVSKADAAYRQALRNKKMAISVVQRDYPAMSFIYDHDVPAMAIDDVALDLAPDWDAVRSDIENLLDIFHNFDDGGDFIGDLASLRLNHYKFLMYMLGSPFVAKLRCTAYATEVSELSMPMFVILTSRQPNTGKTFMVRVALSLMTGKPLNGEKATGKELADRMRKVQQVVKCTPFLFDEVSSRSFGLSLKDVVINADLCEIMSMDQQPVIVLTSNEMDDPNDVVRKRSVHFLFNAAIRSDADPNQLRNRGNRLVRKFTGAFYRDFCRRMIPEVSDMLDRMWAAGNTASNGDLDDWYPDVPAATSRIFLRMLDEYGFQAPDYMTLLNWNEDYSSARRNADVAISEIQSMYNMNPGAFDFSDGVHAVIDMGTDAGLQKRMKSWANTLPAEAEPQCYTSRQGASTLTVNLEGLEAFGFRRRKKFLGLFSRKGGRS